MFPGLYTRTVWGSGADVPWFGLEMLWKAAGKEGSLKHMQLEQNQNTSVYCKAMLLVFVWEAFLDYTYDRCQPTWSSHIRSASEIHPRKREFLEMNISSNQKLAFSTLTWIIPLPGYSLLKTVYCHYGWNMETSYQHKGNTPAASGSQNLCWSRTTKSWPVMILGMDGFRGDDGQNRYS